MVDPTLTYQSIYGYGQGSMDQANVPWFEQLTADAREELLDRLYTLQGDGLGLTICRTYICAGDAPGHAHMNRRPGGSTAPLGYELQPGEFQWNGHEPSLWHAQGAAKRGAFMVAFFNSPPWWLTVSGCTSGSAGGTNNLRAGQEDRFAQHICDVLQHYRDAWGVTFQRVSPINEPEADWWKEGGGQDGCHVDAAQAATLIGALGRRLSERGLPARVQAPEAAFSQSLAYLDELLADAAAYQAITELTCHQYITDFHSLRRWPLRSRLHSKPLWMSEWGDWTNKGAELALNYACKLHEAHRLMQAVAWCMWEPSFLFDLQGARLVPNQAYYVVAQFTRFARPGMKVIEATDTMLRSTAYLDEGTRRLVVITINETADTVQVSYDLSAFQGLRGIHAWRTSEAERLAPVQVPRTPSGLLCSLPPRSVTTFLSSYEGLGPSFIVNGGFETGRLDGWEGTPPQMTGVQDNYPHGGSYDAFIDLLGDAKGELSQLVTGLVPGASYVLSAACATSGLEAKLAVEGQGLTVHATVSGGAYQLVRLHFTAPPDGAVRVFYRAGPSDQPQPWATLDNVHLSPVIPAP